MKRLFFVVMTCLFLAGEVQAQGPTPTPTSRYHLIEDAEPITYTTWESISATIPPTMTIDLDLDYRQMASYALTAYDFFSNVSYIFYVIPFVIAMKVLHWLYRYVTGLRINRDTQYEIDLSEVLGTMEGDRNKN